jgi:hypothetical protein
LNSKIAVEFSMVGRSRGSLVRGFWPVPYFKKRETPLAMDRALSKWLVYLGIALMVAILWEHSGPIGGLIRARIGDWWH